MLASTLLPLALLPGALVSCAATKPADSGPIAGATTSTTSGAESTPSTTATPSPDGSTPAPGLAGGVVTQSAGVQIVHDHWAELGYRWSWSSTPYLTPGKTVELLEPQGDIVIALDQAALMTVIDADTGSRRWSLQASSALTKFTDVTRIGGVLLASSRPEVLAFEASSGNVLARQPPAIVLNTPPVIVGGIAVYGTPTGELLGHRFGSPDGSLLPAPFNDGLKAWGYLLDGAITATPVRVGDVVAAVTQRGDILFIDPLTGSSVGRGRIASGLANNPVSDGENLYIAALDQSVYAYKPFGAAQLWRYRTDAPLRDQPAVHDGTVYVSVPTQGIQALDATTGDVKWTCPDARGSILGVRNDELIVWDPAVPTLALVERTRGTLIYAFDAPGVRALIPDGFVDPNLYAVGASGVVIRFEPRK